MKRTILTIGLGLALVGGLTACGTAAASTETSAAAAPSTFTLTGSITLDDNVQGTRWDGKGLISRVGCSGMDGYDDMQPGASVVVYGPSDDMVGVGSITSSISHPEDRLIGTVTINRDTCELSFAVPNVPTGLGIYSYEVSHRGKLPLTEAEATAGPVNATLG